MFHQPTIKMMKFKTTLLFIAAMLFTLGCEDHFSNIDKNIDDEESRQNKKGQKEVTTSEDEDSDRPDWAGGNPDDNPHIRGNDDSGTTRGGDYGDLYVLLRDINLDPSDPLYGKDGIPILSEFDVLDEEGNPTGETFWVVRPIDSDGNVIDLDQYGELPEGAPVIEVDFGRLNIVRSPQSVLDQAFNEALKVLAAPGAQITLDFCGRLTSTYPDPITSEIIVKTIDSPRENMAIYQYIMKYLFEGTVENNWNNRLGFLKGQFDPLMIAASCFAAGSDKTGTVDVDEVVYITGFVEGFGLDPVINTNELDFFGDPKQYFRFSNSGGVGNEFVYSRQETYQNRYLQFQIWDNVYYPPDEDGNWTGPIFSVLEVMEDKGLFTHVWGSMLNTGVSGFALAVDDAVQVLDYVHGDSNIQFVPDYQP